MTYKGTYGGDGTTPPILTAGVSVEAFRGGSAATTDEASMDALFAGKTAEATYVVATWNHTLVPGWGTINDAPQIIIDNHASSDDFSTRWTGYFYVEEFGTWEFVTSSDDGSDLFIDGVKVADYYGGHAAQAPTQGGNGYGSVFLSAGWHSMVARQSEGGGGAAEFVYYRSPSMVQASAAWVVLGVDVPVAIEMFDPGDYLVATGSGTLNKQDFYVGARLLAKGDPTGSVWLVVNPLPTPAYESSSIPGTVIATATPSADIIAQFEADSVQVVRQVDIYESDNETIFLADVGFEGGSVSVDMTRSERRNLDITLNDDRLDYGPGAFWYDKIIRPYRGIKLDTGDNWLMPLGSFLPDNITRQRFPGSYSVSCRDFSKKLILSKFGSTISFPADTKVADVIHAIAVNGGITHFNFQSPEDTLNVDAGPYDVGTERMSVCVELATSINHEVFFDAFGAMVLRPYVDPLTAPVSHTFLTGVSGNLVDFGRTTTDTFMFNDVFVYGSDTSNAGVNGRATNTNDLSPTSVNNVGQRTKTIPNAYVTDNGAAISIAQSYLSVSGLEQYDLSMTSLVAPWLEAGDAILAQLPDASITDPDRFLLSSFSIPLALESMTASAKRVILVG